MVLPVVGQGASLVGCSSPLDVVWGFATWPGVGATHITVGSSEGQAILGDVVHFQVLSFV